VHVAAGPKTVVELGKLAQRMGLHVGENPHFGGVDPVHVAGSYHYKGEAIDVSGDAKKMALFAQEVADYREVYLAFASAYETQTARKQANVDWLVTQRKKLWHLMADDPDGNGPNDRQTRYENLCIATHYGQVYIDWDAAHNKWGQPHSENTRDAIKQWLDGHIGVHEAPDGSNKGEAQPSTWQRRVYGSDGVPWCACFSVCSAWDNGVSGTGTAGVANNTELAKRGEGIYRGFTTGGLMDPRLAAVFAFLRDCALILFVIVYCLDTL
jgi:hypothetical protein